MSGGGGTEATSYVSKFSKAGEAVKKTYRMGPGKRAFMLGTAAVLTGIPLVIGIFGAIEGNKDAIAAAVAIFLAMSFAIFILVFFAWFPRMTFDRDGITTRGSIGFSSVTVPWHNIETFYWLPGKEGLVLRQSQQVKALQKLKNWAHITYQGSPMYDDQQREWIMQERYVQLSPFAHAFLHGDALEQLDALQPRLAELLRGMLPAYAEQKGKDRRAVWWALGLIVLFTGLAFGAAAIDWHVPAGIKDFSDRFGPWVLFGLQLVMALGVSCYGILNLNSSWYYLKLKQYGVALMWLLMGLLQFGLALAFIGAALS